MAVTLLFSPCMAHSIIVSAVSESLPGNRSFLSLPLMLSEIAVSFESHIFLPSNELNFCAMLSPAPPPPSPPLPKLNIFLLFRCLPLLLPLAWVPSPSSGCA
ncbi:hypothetical protein K438DRAFT_226302 [Mycena galopus ATCC 62051]|nr:hypothetical protein K438DRAFT_226302 [Mycena galopus ATCC 62051]